MEKTHIRQKVNGRQELYPGLLISIPSFLISVSLSITIWVYQVLSALVCWMNKVNKRIEELNKWMSEWIEYDGRLKAVVKYGLKQVYSDKKQGRDLDL